MTIDRSPVSVSVLDANNLTLAGIGAALEGDSRFKIARLDARVDRTQALAAEIANSDLVLVDPTSAGRLVAECLPPLLAQSARVVIHTDYFEPQYFLGALLGGIYGYITKSATDAERLLDLLWVIAHHQVLVIDGRLAHYFWEKPGDRVVLYSPSDTLASITPRQEEIVRMLTQGLSDGEIALKLDVSLSTVQTHILNIERTLGARSRFELALKAVQTGLINLSAPRPGISA